MKALKILLYLAGTIFALIIGTAGLDYIYAAWLAESPSLQLTEPFIYKLVTDSFDWFRIGYVIIIFVIFINLMTNEVKNNDCYSR